MDYRSEYKKWLENVTDGELLEQLRAMDDESAEDAFFRDLVFGTGGLRGTIGAGTNRMNVYVVSRASQGLADYLLDRFDAPSVVIGYDSRVKSDVFSKAAACVFAANGIKVHIWPQLSPVPTVSFAVRFLGASQGIMITASHNPSAYNGYKVYGADGCQITTAAADSILAKINCLDFFSDVKTMSFDEAVREGKIRFISDEVLDEYLEAVKNVSVLYGDNIDKNVSIVYSPLNGTGLIPVTKVLEESGFTDIILVDEQRLPDGNFPTCPYPNPEIREAMELGLRYAAKNHADLLLATDPDADRCGIAVKSDSGNYELLTGNEVGLLCLDYICSQRCKHSGMPKHPVFIKTIVTTDLAEAIASSYGCETVNVLTGFKYIGEQIGYLESKGREDDFIFGFEESYGYLSGTYVRDKDGVNAAFLICEMFAYYKTRDMSLLQKLQELYDKFGYCLNTLHSYEFPGSAGMKHVGAVMDSFRLGIKTIGDNKVLRNEDYSKGLYGLPKSDVLKFYFDCGSVVIRPSGTEPKLKVYISVRAEHKESAKITEANISDAVNRMICKNKEH